MLVQNPICDMRETRKGGYLYCSDRSRELARYRYRHPGEVQNAMPAKQFFVRRARSSSSALARPSHLYIICLAVFIIVYFLFTVSDSCLSLVHEGNSAMKRTCLCFVVVLSNGNDP